MNLPSIAFIAALVIGHQATAQDLSVLCTPDWLRGAKAQQIAEEIQSLAEAGTVGRICSSGATPLHFAETAEQVDPLVGKGAEVDRKSDDGATAIFSASAFGNAEVIRALVAAGADPDLPSDYGDAPLHQAVRSLQKDAVTALLDSGADTSLRGADGFNAIELALRYSQWDIAEAIWRHPQTERMLEFGIGRIEVPKTPGWELPVLEGGRLATFRSTTPGHSFVLRVGVSTDFPNEIAYALASDPWELLGSQVENIREGLQNGRFTLESFQSWTAPVSVADCIQYKLSARDMGIFDADDQPYYFQGTGLVCSVRKYPAYLEIDYSERWPSFEVGSNIDSSASEIFMGLQID